MANPGLMTPVAVWTLAGNTLPLVLLMPYWGRKDVLANSRSIARIACIFSPRFADRTYTVQFCQNLVLGVWQPLPRRTGSAVVACAGTADLPVAEEAAGTLTALGWPPARLTDVGVAGIHRLLAEEPVLQASDVIVVVAGMEGALASAVGGLAAAPVISVPTSAGYGSSLEGVTALLAMLASCAPGVAVMGIDNGYGAAVAAARILAALERARTGDRR